MPGVVFMLGVEEQGRMSRTGMVEGAARPELRRRSRHGGMEPAITMCCCSSVVAPQSRYVQIKEEEKREDLEEGAKQGNGTVDWVQELLQKIHAVFRNRNFVQGLFLWIIDTWQQKITSYKKQQGFKFRGCAGWAWSAAAILRRRSSLLSKGVSLFVSFISSLQASTTRSIVKRFIGSSWSASAIDTGCSHLLQYHTMPNVLFMAKTEFLKLHD